MIVVEERWGSAGELHALDPFGPEERDRHHTRVWLCRPRAAAIVLGSAQSDDVVDSDACTAARIEIARRRSGGGAVLVRPGDVVWIDVIVPHGIAPDDVRGSMVWIGLVWREALVGLGGDPSLLVVHDGPLRSTAWSTLVCFAGTGPGEVMVRDRKLVGLSQRRTRDGIRVQCQVHRTSLLADMPPLLAGPLPVGDLGAAAVLGDVMTTAPSDAVLAAAVASRLEDRIRTTPV